MLNALLNSLNTITSTNNLTITLSNLTSTQLSILYPLFIEAK
jgi:hypothetical protein